MQLHDGQVALLRQNHFALFSNLAVATLQTGKKGAYLALLDQAEACATNDQQKATVKEHREKFFQEIGVVRVKTARVSGRTVKQPSVEYEEVTFRLAA